MQRLVLASHGYLAEGMKNSAQIIVGKSAKIYTICAYVKEGITLESQINELFDSFPEDDEMIVVTDIFGGSVNNEFMQRLQNRRFWLSLRDESAVSDPIGNGRRWRLYIRKY